MSPFDTQHLPQLSETWGSEATANDCGDVGTKTDRLLTRLCQGPANALELVEVADVRNRHSVSRLLYRHTKGGMIVRDGLTYTITPWYKEALVLKAKATLRAAGWTVIAP